MKNCAQAGSCSHGSCPHGPPLNGHCGAHLLGCHVNCRKLPTSLPARDPNRRTRREKGRKPGGKKHR